MSDHLQRSNESSNENNFQIKTNNQGENQIYIPCWEEEGSSSTVYQQLIEENKFYKNKCLHLENHLQENHRQFNNLNQLYVISQSNERRFCKQNDDLRKKNRELASQISQYKMTIDDLIGQKNMFLKREADFRQRLSHAKAQQNQYILQNQQLQIEIQNLRRRSHNNESKSLNSSKQIDEKRYFNEQLIEIQNRWKDSYNQLQKEFDKKSKQVRQKIEENKSLNKTILLNKQQNEELIKSKNEEIDDLKRTIQKLKANLNDSQRQRKEFQSIIEEVSNKNDQIEGENIKLSMKLKEETQRYIKIEKEHRELNEVFEQKNQIILQKEEQILKLTTLIQKLKSKVGNLESDLKLKIKHLQQKSTNEISKQYLDDGSSEKIKELQKSIQTLKQQLDNQRRKQVNMTQRQNQLLQKQNNDLKNLAEENEKLKHQIQTLLKENKTKDEIISKNEMKQQNKILLSRIKEYQQKLGNLQNEILGKNNQILKSNLRINQLQKKITQTYNQNNMHGQCNQRYNKLEADFDLLQNSNKKNINTINELNEMLKQQNKEIQTLKLQRDNGISQMKNEKQKLQTEKNKIEKYLLQIRRINQQKQTIEGQYEAEKQKNRDLQWRLNNKIKQHLPKEPEKLLSEKLDIQKIRKYEEKISEMNSLLLNSQQKQKQYQNQIQTLKAKLKNTNSEFNEKVKKIELKIIQKQKLINEKQQQIEKLQSQLNDANKKQKQSIKEWSQRLKKIEIKASEKEDLNMSLANKIEEQTIEIDNLKEKNKTLQKQLKMKDSELTKKEKKLKENEQILKQKITNLEEIEQQNQTKKQNYEGMLQKIKKQLQKVKKQLKTQQNLVIKLKQEMNNEQNDDIEVDGKKDNNRILQLQSKNSKLVEELKRKKNQIERLNKDLDDYKRQNNKQEDRNQKQFIVKIDRLQKQIRRLQKIKSQLQRQYQDYRQKTEKQLSSITDQLEKQKQKYSKLYDKKNQVKANDAPTSGNLQQLQLQYNRQLQALRRIILYKGYKEDHEPENISEIKRQYEEKIQLLLKEYKIMQVELNSFKEKLTTTNTLCDNLIERTEYPIYSNEKQRIDYERFEIYFKQRIIRLEEEREVFLDKIALWQKKYQQLRFLYEVKLQSKDEAINLLSVKLSSFEACRLGQFSCQCHYH